MDTTRPRVLQIDELLCFIVNKRGRLKKKFLKTKLFFIICMICFVCLAFAQHYVISLYLVISNHPRVPQISSLYLPNL